MGEAIQRWADKARRRVVDFIDARSTPVNLAVFRITVFASLLQLLGQDRADAAWFASLPAVLREPPPGWGLVAEWLPLTPELARTTRWVAFASSAFALLGVFTRASAAVATLSALYVLGVPQFFGKLIHYHHLVWFSALLALSPCADALSVDALLARSRSGPPEAHRRYALPLRFAWVLIGLVYFFPGAWKLLVVGPAWAVSDNLKWMLYEKWLELGPGFRPLFALDQYPLVYRTAGIYVMAFELGFLPALFFPRVRPFAIAAGLAYHSITSVFLERGFQSLVLCYPVFVDWSALSTRLRGVRTGRGSAGVSLNVSDTSTAWSPGPIVKLGTGLVAAAVLCGGTGLDTWPVAVYPRFSYRAGPTRSQPDVALVDADGHEQPYDDTVLAGKFSSSRWMSLLRRVAKEQDPGRRERLSAAIVEVMYRTSAPPEGTRQIRVYDVTLATDPAERATNPLQRALLYELTPGREGTGAARGS